MAKRYFSAFRNVNQQVYEIVCLMRLNGMRVERTGPTNFAVRMSHLRKWTVHEMTTRQLMAKYKDDAATYALLRSHPKAHTIPKAGPARVRIRVRSKHKDLVG